jgi:hypothetical protein
VSKCRVSTVVFLRSSEVKLPEALIGPRATDHRTPGLPPLNRALIASVPFESLAVASQRKVLRSNRLLPSTAVI